MSDVVKELLILVNKGVSINEMCERLNLSHKQIYNLFRMISPMGFDFDRRYYDNGDIIYTRKEVVHPTLREGVSIITNPGDIEMKIMVLSDLHLGNSKERIDLLNRGYEYCVKNGIHLIINGGDIVDGLTSMHDKGDKIHDSFYDQIEYAYKNYPFDKSILNFICFGNHDMDAYINSGQDIAKFLYSYRHDLVPLGYGLGQINIKNEKIIVKHHLDKDYKIKGIDFNNSIILKGHSHIYDVCYNVNNNNIEVKIPTLSDCYVNTDDMPAALVMDLTFSDGVVSHVRIEHLIFGDKIYSVGTSNFNRNRVKGFDPNNIHNEEKRKVRKLTPVKESKENEGNKKGQIDKFNKKWNI